MIGTTLSNYRITAKLGQGGMGEVWRAEDTKLGRDVALKMLPEDFADDPDRHSRFEREAKVLASLNHSNIAMLHALEHLEGQHVLVMELVEGDGLDEVIARGPIPIDEATAMALQIAEALEAAHEAGIVHRDLKPANIKVRPDGTVKVLDFGLAKAWEAEGGDSSLSLSPTMTKHATAAGVILGTAAYMSPEQARGKMVDRRADIWAFGVVLWEMLTGKKLFGGETVSDVLAAVLKERPDLEALPSNVPGRLRALLERCFESDPRRRLRDIGEARVILADLVSGVDPGDDHEKSARGTTEHVGRLTKLKRLLPWGMAAAIAAFVWFVTSSQVDRPPRLVASFLSPTDGGFEVYRGMELSPDGGELAFPAVDEEGRRDLWVRNLNSGESRKLAGTRGAEAPFWSPDGKHIVFFADGELKSIEHGNGVIETLTDVQFVYGGDWGQQGSIVLGNSWTTRLRTISAGGGPDTLMENGDSSGPDLLVWPTFLPDGRHFIYLARRYASENETGEIRLASLDDPSPRVLLQSNSNAIYAEPGYLLWWRDGNLRAQRFDPDRLELVGESTAVIPNVRFEPDLGRMAVTVSSDGLLIYQAGGEQAGDELVLLDRRGNEIAQVAPPDSYYGPRLSPDGLRVVSDVSDSSNKGDLWVYDISRGVGERVTSFPEDETRPRWSSEGKQIVYSSMTGADTMTIWVCDLRGGEPELMFADPSANLRVTDWASNGLVLLDRPDGDQYDIYFFSAETGELGPWLATPFNETAASASPEGDFAAYVSDDSGRQEVWVRSFPEAGQARRVSVNGGDWPAWRADGGEIFYRAPDGWLMAVPVRWIGSEEGRQPEFGTPEPLFRFDSKKHLDRQYDTLDGERFLVNRSVNADADIPLTLVQGWDEALLANDR